MGKTVRLKCRSLKGVELHRAVGSRSLDGHYEIRNRPSSLGNYGVCMRTAGYNPRHTMITGTWKFSAVLTCLVALATIGHAVEWDEPAAALARNIASISGPGTVALAVKNSSAIPAEKIPEIR